MRAACFFQKSNLIWHTICLNLNVYEYPPSHFFVNLSRNIIKQNNNYFICISFNWNCIKLALITQCQCCCKHATWKVEYSYYSSHLRFSTKFCWKWCHREETKLYWSSPTLANNLKMLWAQTTSKDRYASCRWTEFHYYVYPVFLKVSRGAKWGRGAMWKAWATS